MHESEDSRVAKSSGLGVSEEWTAPTALPPSQHSVPFPGLSAHCLCGRQIHGSWEGLWACMRRAGSVWEFMFPIPVPRWLLARAWLHRNMKALLPCLEMAQSEGCDVHCRAPLRDQAEARTFAEIALLTGCLLGPFLFPSFPQSFLLGALPCSGPANPFHLRVCFCRS